MGDIVSQIFVLPVRIILIVTAIVLVLLWIVSIIWVNRDAKERQAAAGFWTLVAIVPVAGIIAYCLLRPPLNSADSMEQTMNIELMGRELADYGNCPKCGAPVKQDYIACPFCSTQLRNVCHVCGKPLEPNWEMCPYCATSVNNQPHQNRQRSR